MSGVVANVWRFFVFVVAGAIVLGMLGINLTPLLASATIIGATLGFGAQQIVRDYFSGILMTMEDQFNVGDSVTVGGVTGVVEEVTMRLTRFRGVDGTIFVIPNGDIRLVGNLSRGWARAIVDFTLPGASAADMERLRSVIAAAAHEVATSPAFAGHCTEPPTVVGLQSADSTTVTMRVMLLTVPSQRDALTRALREATLEALAKAALWPAEVRTTDVAGGLSGDQSGAGSQEASRGSTASAACHMASTGAGCPVQSTSWAAAWCTSMPSPSTGGRPPRPPPPASGSAGGRRPGRRDLAGCEELRRHQPVRGAPVEAPAMPNGVALTTSSAASTASTWPFSRRAGWPQPAPPTPPPQPGRLRSQPARASG